MKKRFFLACDKKKNLFAKYNYKILVIIVGKDNNKNRKNCH